MTTPLLWLAHFLKARSLDHPDGRMLYAYRLSEQEYASLRELLRVWLGGDTLRGGGHLSRGTAELFVLYGASWWQREYGGGKWRWDDVIESFGGDSDWWPHEFRSQCVEVGLQFWKQEIRTVGVRFFGVLVEQGGLPRVLLAQSKGNIYALIRALLKRAARLGARADEITTMVSDYGDKLPHSLRTESMYLLIAQVVDTVLSLKREFQLTGRDSALAKLDRLAPHWRERFPIALDDHAAVALLGDLVGDAAEIEAETRAAPILIDRLLVKEQDRFRLMSRIEFPKTMEAAALARLLGVDVDSLPFRFSLDFLLDQRYPAADVRKALGHGGGRYQLALLKSSWSDEAALREHLLYVALPGRPPASVPVPGGMELDLAVPWVFTESGDECRLAAQGSTRIRQDQAYVVVDRLWRVEPADEHCRAELLGHLSDEAHARSVFLVSGHVIVDTGTHRLNIRTQEAGVEPERPVWEGARPGFATTPGLTFYGVPKLCRYTADGQRLVVPPHQLEWRRAGKAQVLSPSEIRGPVDVFWRVDGELRQRSRMVILDRQSRLRFRSGDSVTKGTIDFPLAWGMESVSISDDAIRLNVEFQAACLSAHVTAIDAPPASIKLTLDWKSSPVPLQVSLPFPASGGRFLRPDEKPLPNGATITRDQLLGVRLRIVDSNPNDACRYKMVFSLTSRCHGGVPTDVHPIEHEVALHGGQSVELRLFDYQTDIESLLSLTDALDAVVTVSLWAGRRNAATLQVKRYEFALIPDGSYVAIAERDLARLSCSELAEINLLAASIDAMHDTTGLEMAPVMSEGVPTGRWSLPASAAGSPCLVYPAAGSCHSFRAVLMQPQRQPASPISSEAVSAGSLPQALVIDAPHIRREALARRLDALADDFSHPDWAVVEGIWSNLGHLTLPTLDLWRTFAIHPQALAAFACRHWAEHTQEEVLAMCGRFQDELGVLWETIPLKIWNSACRKFNGQWQRVLPAGELAPLITKKLAQTLRGLREHFPVLSTLLALVSFQQTGEEADTIAPLCRSQSRLPALSAQLWQGEHSAVQSIMLRRSADRDPPRLQLYWDLVRNLELPEPIRLKAGHFIWTAPNPKVNVANMPVLLALSTWAGLLPDWWRDPKRLVELRQFRDFDREWFRYAFDHTIAMCITAGFTLPR